ncbi:hypothetical protein lerEdw1_020302 [Lerista edwardsae]|nr:hypothetical protein lerEdw1_020302 [Lerista edwardsae]
MQAKFRIFLSLVLTVSNIFIPIGRNPYCIDKNYGGTLIIWDRIFGTFVAEDEKVVYGLTHPINTFELFKVQFHHCISIWNTFWSTPGFCNKISVVFKGPGWEPGKPRLGIPEDIPKITGKEVPYGPKLPISLRVYAVIHFILMLGCYIVLFATKSCGKFLGRDKKSNVKKSSAKTLSQVTLLLRVGYIILTLTSIGFLMEQRPEAALLETARCTTFLALHRLGYLKTYNTLLSLTYEIFTPHEVCWPWECSNVAGSLAWLLDVLADRALSPSEIPGELRQDLIGEQGCVPGAPPNCRSQLACPSA